MCGSVHHDGLLAVLDDNAVSVGLHTSSVKGISVFVRSDDYAMHAIAAARNGPGEGDCWEGIARSGKEEALGDFKGVDTVLGILLRGSEDKFVEVFAPFSVCDAFKFRPVAL